MDHTSSSTATVADDSRTRDERSRNDVDISMNVLRQAASLNRAANTLPRLGETYELCMSYGVFSEYMAVSRERILSLTQKLFSAGGVRMRMPRDLTDLSGLIDRVVDGNDIISERAGILIDEIAKTHRREAVSVPKAISQAECTTRSVDACNPGSTHGQVLSVPLRTGGPQSIAQLARLRAISRHKEIISKVVAIKKPQIEYGFSSYVNNTHDAFTPKLTRKHNALDRQAPSGIAIVDEVSSYTQPWLSDEAENVHPYATELLHFSVPLHQTKSSPVLVYKSLEDTPLKFVNTKEDLEELRKYLTSVDEFSVDIEHHDYRSFLGFCCLLQISTRDKDFIVDPFPIWEHVSLLNEPFTDPKILKVFHGADKDILWLQRDFGIYVVNMFDTGRAMRHLGMPKLSLQFLVDNFCGVQLNKQYQTTDWRVRPLSNEMLHYAREDTHYLLYCYDKLREQLIAAGNSDTNNLLKAVYADSKDLCSKIFEKPLFDPIGFSAFIASKRSFNNRQMFALRELWRWRDETARSEDESLAYVLPSHMMLHIAESLPRDMQGILACCSPVPTPVKEHLLILHRIVLEARDRPLERLATNLGGSAQEADGNLSVLAKARRAKNKLDHLTGRLLTALDIHFNEEDHEILKKIAHTCDNQELDFKELKNTHLCVLYHVPVAASSVSSRDVNLSSQSRASGVRSRFAAMASPYECFLLAVKEREKRQEAERKTQLDKPTEVVTEKRYSHHDPTVCRKPIFDEETRNSDDIAVTGMEGEGASNANSLFEEQTLTKKGLKRKMKESRDAADLKLESQAKSVKKEEAVEPPVPVVNYAAFDPQMFEHQPRGSHSYNPFGRGRAPGRGRGNRGGGRGARGHQGQGRGGRGRSSFR